MPLGELQRLEHRAGDALQLERAVGVYAGQHTAVDRHGVELRIHAADVEPIRQPFVGRAAGDARQSHYDFARAHVGQVAEGIHCHDVLHVFGVALLRDRGGIALAFPGDLECVHFVKRRREIEIPLDPPARRNRHRSADRIEADIGDLEVVRARRNTREHVATGRVGEDGVTQLGQDHPGALEQVTRGDIAHGTAYRAGARLGSEAASENENEPRQKDGDGVVGFHG